MQSNSTNLLLHSAWHIEVTQHTSAELCYHKWKRCVVVISNIIKSFISLMPFKTHFLQQWSFENINQILSIVLAEPRWLPCSFLESNSKLCAQPICAYMLYLCDPLSLSSPLGSAMLASLFFTHSPVLTSGSYICPLWMKGSSSKLS